MLDVVLLAVVVLDVVVLDVVVLDDVVDVSVFDDDVEVVTVAEVVVAVIEVNDVVVTVKLVPVVVVVVISWMKISSPVLTYGLVPWMEASLVCPIKYMFLAEREFKKSVKWAVGDLTKQELENRQIFALNSSKLRHC